MSHTNPLQGAGNTLGALGDMGMGLSCLGMVLQAADVERIKDPDAFIHGIGYLVETVGNSVMEYGHCGQLETERVLGKAA
jgi:hypothetical protein